MPESTAPCELLLIGTAHLDNPGRDMVNLDVDDVLADRRQQDLALLAEGLVRFAPTKVVVEFPVGASAELRSWWHRYLNRDGTRSRSEIEQIGFRVAERMAHDKVYGIDVQDEFWDERVDPLIAADGPFYDRWQELQQEAVEQIDQQLGLLEHQSLVDLLAWLNEPAVLANALGLYLKYFVPMVSDGEYPGAHITANWYRRNLKIFANLLQISGAGERLLVVYGHGHVPVLAHFCELAPDLELVEASGFLRPR